jgi:hypothetical protein
MKIEKTLLPRTVAEKQEFSRLGVAVRSALIASAVIDKGAAALLRIRDGQLYREDFESYDAYLASEGITRRRADQLVAFFKIQQGVSNTLGTAVPETFDTLSERSLRPLVGMPSEVAAAAVLEAAASPGGISPKSIAVAAKRRKKAVRKPVFKSRRFLVPGAVVSVTFNLSLIHISEPTRPCH